MISAKGTPAEAQAAAETVRLKVLVPTLAVTKFRMFPSSIPIQEAIVQFNECVSRLPAGAERTYALHFTHLDINPSIHQSIQCIDSADTCRRTQVLRLVLD